MRNAIYHSIIGSNENCIIPRIENIFQTVFVSFTVSFRINNNTIYNDKEFFDVTIPNVNSKL